MILVMPKKSQLKLPPLDTGAESIGERLARLRKERGFTQVELAERIGIIQALVSDYERDKLRLNADMLARYAQALEVSADEILGLRKSVGSAGKPSAKLLRRFSRIESLPLAQQKTVLRSIDMLLRGAVGV
jgi:transcriptional regulator with XRE-family HTH domain